MHSAERLFPRIVPFFLLLVLAFSSHSAVGQVWTGASQQGSNLWSDNDNWEGGVAPVSGTSLVLFDDPTLQATSFQDLGSNTTFRLGQLTYETSSGNFELGGNEIIVENQFSVAGGGELNINTGLTFVNGASFDIEDGSTYRTTSSLAIENSDGTAELDITGSGVLEFGTGGLTTTAINVASGVTTVFDNCGAGQIFITQDAEFNGRTSFRDSEVTFLAEQTFNNDVDFEADSFVTVFDINASISGTTTVRSGAFVQLFLGTGNQGDIGIRGPGGLVVESGGELEIGPDVIVSKNIQIDDGGRLLGMGNVEGTLEIFGLLDPGTSIGTLSVDGDVDLFETTTTCIELAGSMEGEFDLIAGIGDDANNINLDGELEVSFLDGFVPDADDEFSFITGFNISGLFSNTTDDGGGSSLLSFTESTFGTLVTSDGTFTIEYGSDFVRLFGFQPTAVPEPGSAVLISMAIIGIAVRRRKI